jgi:hypothetical protein
MSNCLRSTVERVLIRGLLAHAEANDVNRARRWGERSGRGCASATARRGLGNGVSWADGACSASAAGAGATDTARRAGRAAEVRGAHEARVEKHGTARRAVDDDEAVMLFLCWKVKVKGKRWGVRMHDPKAVFFRKRSSILKH